MAVAAVLINMNRSCLLFSRNSRLHIFLCHPRIGLRSLFSQEALGITGYIRDRQKIALQFENQEETFKKRMNLYLEDTQKYKIFIDDLKHMLHLVQNEEDLQLACHMMKQFNKQKTIRFSSFTFGPVAMRCCHYFTFPDAAFEFLNNKDYDGLFDQLSSFSIAMDLLLETNNYQKLIEAFEIMQDKRFFGTQFPVHSILLAFAACYKQNTPESYQYVLKVIQDAAKADYVLKSREAMFAIALALKQNDPQNAMEILSKLSMLKDKMQFFIINFQIMGYADLDRLDEVFRILTDFINRNYPNKPKKSELWPEIIEKLKSAAARNGKQEIINTIEKMIQTLLTGSLIMSSSLDEYLFKPILAKTEQQPPNFSPVKSRIPSRFKSLYDLDE